MKFLAPILTVLSMTVSTYAAEWQWSIPVSPLEGSKESPKAFLWIPDDCKQVRGVVFAHHNMEELPILEHPAFRKVLTELGFAEIWVAPTFDPYFRFDQGAGERFEAMLSQLADESGYSELKYAPLVPLGHSAAASMPWYIAMWKPQRVLCGISTSGQWPYVLDEKNAPQAAGHTLDTVPALVTMGEYEWADENLPKGFRVRKEHPQLPLTAVGCPADGHFAAMDEKVELISLYLKIITQYRLPKNAPLDREPELTSIDPTKSGWLYDRYQFNRDSEHIAAPVADFKGKPEEAFWALDQELAQAISKFQSLHRGKPALLGYVQNDAIVTQVNGTHQQVTLNFLPEADGITFKLSGTFLDTVPEGRPARWAAAKAGSAIEKPEGGPPIEIRKICGPIKKLSEDTWTLDFNNASFLNDRRGNEAWLVAIWPGNDTYKRAVQQSKLNIPSRNSKGIAQTITFPKIDDISKGAASIELKATSDSGLPVHYFVSSGPALIDGNQLKLLPIPPRSKFPVKITVTAWQFGKMSEPQVQSAAPVTQTFSLIP